MEKEIDCHFCGGKSELLFEELSLNNGKITIKDSPYYKCKKCGEAFSTSRQMQELSDEINSKFCFSRPVIAAGRSLAITLPKDLIEYCKIKKGKLVKLIPETKHRIGLIIE